ncbi:MAG TPA: DUF1304 family protein [Streptosporangiaceae bacterium]|jgi:putative membrane protein
MNAAIPTAVCVAASILASATHGYIFAKESILFPRPRTQAMLEVAAEHATAVRLWAFHQGIYNLLLGTVAVAGAVAMAAGAFTIAATLIVTFSVSMIVAAASLFAADARRARVPGLIAQALPAVSALVALAFA